MALKDKEWNVDSKYDHSSSGYQSFEKWGSDSFSFTFFRGTKYSRMFMLLTELIEIELPLIENPGLASFRGPFLHRILMVSHSVFLSRSLNFLLHVSLSINQSLTHSLTYSLTHRQRHMTSVLLWGHGQVVVGDHDAKSLEKVMVLCCRTKEGVRQGADETSLMLRVMHVNVTGTGGLSVHPTECFGIIYHKTFVFFCWGTVDPG